MEQAAADVEAIGPRRLDKLPLLTRAAACPEGVYCLAADVDGDRRTDLVQIDYQGKLGKPGGVWVANGNGWSFGASRLEAICEEGASCTVGDTDGDSQAELIGFRVQKGEVYAASLGRGVEGSKPHLYLADFCAGEKPRCLAADISGDKATDLVWLTDDGNLELAVQQDGKWLRWAIKPSPCVDGRACTLGNVDGEPGVELVAMSSAEKALPIEVIALWPKGESEPAVWLEQACAAGSSCRLRDMTGDGRADLIELSDAMLTVYAAGKKRFTFAYQQPVPLCTYSNRCWLADGTADGRADLWIVDLEGILSIFANRDSIGRLDSAARALSILNQDYERGRRKQNDTALTALFRAAIPTPAGWDGSFENADFRWPATVTAIDPVVYEDRAGDLEADIEHLTGEVLSLIPPATDLLDAVTQRRWQRAAGHVIAARTALYAGPLGATPRAGIERCGNVVLHDRYRIDGADHVEGSYLARYFDALREPEQDDRVEHSVGALTAIYEGLRCLSENELAELEAAFVEAVVTTANDLIARGHPVLARRMWDRSLPIALIFFDATHHFSVPTTWRLLEARIDGGRLEIPPAPDPGFDFAAAASDPACETLWCQLYRHPAREDMDLEVLTLDEIGVWLADVRQGNRLIRMDILGDELIEGLIDLRHLGEGGCQLFEVLSLGMRCPTARTCSAADTMLAEVAGPLEPTPGSPGSRWTHLFTDRMTLAADNGCTSGGSGGGAGAIFGCAGPPIRNGAGHFSFDPEVDRMFRCAMETAAGSQAVVDDFNFNPDCLLRDPPPDPDESEPPPNPYDNVSDVWEDPETQSQMQNLFEHGSDSTQSGYGRDRESIVTAIIEAARDRGGRVPTRAEVIEAMERLSPDHFGPGRTNTIPDYDLAHPAGTTGGFIFYNPERLAAEAEHFATDYGMGVHEFVTMVMVHEFIHRVVNDLASRDLMDRSWFHDWREVHRTIHRPLGLHARSCGPADTCSSACGLAGALARRFTSCLAETEPPTSEDILCEAAIDYCADRVNGGIGGFDLGSQCEGSPDVDVDADCFVVNCPAGDTISSACCAAMAGGVFAGPVFIDSPDPGPMPPRPGWLCATPRIFTEYPDLP